MKNIKKKKKKQNKYDNNKKYMIRQVYDKKYMIPEKVQGQQF